MLDSQIQAGKAEIVLKTNQQIVLEKMVQCKPSIQADNANPSWKISAIDVLNKKGRVFQAHYIALTDLDSSYTKNAFFDVMFLSVAQLLMLTDGVNGNEVFAKNILRTRHVSLGTRNFYVEQLQTSSTSKNLYRMAS